MCKGYCSLCIAVGSRPYDAFSPNGDGSNDYWYVEDIDKFTGRVVQIYNRWGHLIFEEACDPECWDGTIDGKDAPVGTYYYIIDLGNGDEPFTGTVTIVR